MKRLATAAFVVIVLGAVVVSAIPFLISVETLTRGVVVMVSSLTQHPATFSGDSEISVYPDVSVTATGLNVDGDNPDGAPLLTARSATATIRLWPLLLGRTEIRDVHIQAPHLILQRQPDGAFSTRVAGLFARIAQGEDFELGDLSIDSGVIELRDETGGRELRLTGVVGAVSWRSTDADADASGSFRWRGEPLDFRVAMNRPANLLRGGTTDLRFSLESTVARTSFTGTAALLDAHQLEGNVTASSTSLRDLVALFGYAAGPEPALGPAALSGDVNWVGGEIALDNALVELDGNAAEGALTVTLGDEPFIRGTFAFDRLDLGPYLATFASTPSIAITAPPALIAGVDMRLSAADVVAGDFRGGPLAAAISTSRDTTTLTIGDLSLAGGSVSGTLTAIRDGDPIGAEVDLTLSGVDAQALLADTAAPAILEGQANASVSLKSAGEDWPELAAALDGAVNIAVAEGRIHGFDGEAVRAAAEAGGGTVSADGATDFKELVLALRLGGSVISWDDALLITDGYDAVVDGFVDLASGTSSAQAVITPGDGDETAAERVTVTGDGTTLQVSTAPAAE